MRPVLFRLHGMPIYSYPAMLYLGLVTGVEAADIAARAAGIDPFRVMLAMLLLLIPALIGARSVYVAGHWGLYRGNPRRIWSRKEGGAAQYGGIIVVLPLSLPLVRALHLSWGAFWDVALFGVVVGMIFGRIGCLLEGCCAGRRSNAFVAAKLPNQRGVWARRVPTQCLEAGWAGVLLIAALLMRQKMPFEGALFWALLAGYAAGRLVLVSMREPQPGGGWLTLQHGVSAGLVLLSLVMLVSGWPKL